MRDQDVQSRSIQLCMSFRAGVFVARSWVGGIGRNENEPTAARCREKARAKLQLPPAFSVMIDYPRISRKQPRAR